MTAIAQAHALYAKHGIDLNRELSDHLDFGYVFSTPDRLLLERPVRVDDLPKWNPKNPDAWFVTLAVGDGCLGWFVAQIPYRLPLLAWFRGMKRTDSEIHVVPMDRFLTKV